MKKFFTLIIISVFAVNAFAQNVPTKVNITFKNQTVLTYDIADIDSIWFEGNGSTPSSDVYKLTIADVDFTAGKVVKVMAGDKQVAEVCKEYVRSYGNVDDVLTVIYPMNSEGKADLSKGVIAQSGSSIAWDMENDSVMSYVAGAGELTEVYIENGEIKTSTEATTFQTVTFVTDILTDKRGNSDTKTYPIVKVGVQYWIGKNLSAYSLNDGTAIPMYKATQTSIWNACTTPAYHIYSDDVNDEYQIISVHGVMYNGFAAESDKIAPVGYRVTTMDDWTKLKTYVGASGGGKVRSTDVEAWDGATATNKTGLSITGGGYFSSATDDDKMGTQVYLWTTDKGTDIFGRPDEDVLKCVILGKTSAIQLTGNHNRTFGHYIRCIRE